MARLRLALALIPAQVLLAAAAWPAAEWRPVEDYESQYKRTAASHDPNQWIALADFCAKNLLFKKRGEALEKALALNPGSARVRQLLDHVKVGQKWMTPDEVEADDIARNTAAGRVYYGSGWVAPAEAQKMRDADQRAVGWAEQRRVDARHAVIYSDEKLEVTRRVAAVIDNEFDEYVKFYRDVWQLDVTIPPLQVYLFARRADYDAALLRLDRKSVV
jgi:hypothetical protein